MKHIAYMTTPSVDDRMRSTKDLSIGLQVREDEGHLGRVGYSAGTSYK